MSSLESGPWSLTRSDESSDDEGSSTPVSLLDSSSLKMKRSEYEDVSDPEIEGLRNAR